MKNSGIHWLLAVVSSFAISMSNAEDGRRLLLPEHPLRQTSVIEESGNYFLKADFAQSDLVDPHDERKAGLQQMLTIWASDVDVDFNGKALRSEGSVGEVVVAAREKRRINDVLQDFELVRNLKLHDGHIAAKTGDGIVVKGLGGYEGHYPVSLFSDTDRYFFDYPMRRGDPKYERYNKEDFSAAIDLLPTHSPDYPSRGIHLENMTIQAERYGAVIQGADTVIKNCVIKVGGQTALYLYGPRARIENNIIIVDGQGFSSEGDAPIRLYQGDNALIAGNKIVGKTHTGNHAISLVRSKEVSVENNALLGFGALVKTFDETSTFSERANRIE